MRGHPLVHHLIDSKRVRRIALRIDRVIVCSFQGLVKVHPEEAVPGDSLPGGRSVRQRYDGSEYGRRQNGVANTAVGESEPEA